jgi:hypothetical protein
MICLTLNQKLKLFGILEEVIADKLDTFDGCPVETSACPDEFFHKTKPVSFPSKEITTAYSLSVEKGIGFLKLNLVGVLAEEEVLPLVELD